LRKRWGYGPRQAGWKDPSDATCEEGSGRREFSKLLAEHCSDRNFVERILHSSVVVDQWQQEKLRLVTRITKGFCNVAGFPHEFQGWLWVKQYPTPDSAVQALTLELAPGAAIGVISDGVTFRPVSEPNPTDCSPQQEAPCACSFGELSYPGVSSSETRKLLARLPQTEASCDRCAHTF
jgi:hypothetical protein